MIEPYIPYVAIGLASAIGLVLIAYITHDIVKDRRHREPTFEPPAISDWHPTGKIDAMASADVMAAEDENLPAKFHLLVEETRQVADISGSPIGEVRWRLATRAEVKDIVRRHRLSGVELRQVS